MDDHNVLAQDNCNQGVAQDPMEEEREDGNNLQGEQEEEVGIQVQLDEVSHDQAVCGNEVNTPNIIVQMQTIILLLVHAFDTKNYILSRKKL